MAKDEHGIDPKATDGVPNGRTEEDQLAMTRARKKAAEEAAAARSDEEAAAAMGAKRGAPIDDQPDDDGDERPEMFPQGSIPGDHAVTMKNIAGGKGRKTEAKMGATAIPLRDGLVRYGKLVELLVTVEAGKVEEVPELEEQDAGGERKLLGVKDVQRFRPVHVRSAAGVLTTDQVLDILERHFGLPRSADKVREVFGLDVPTAAAG
jgi:hypothetical protein